MEFSSKSCEMSTRIKKSRDLMLNSYVLSSPSYTMPAKLRQNVNLYHTMQKSNIPDN
jgi:hypothetical protein